MKIFNQSLAVLLLLFGCMLLGCDPDPDKLGYECSQELQHYEEQAGQGNAHAQFCLGEREHNLYVDYRDYPKALKWFRLAAAQNHSYAQYYLGIMYYAGEGVPQNREEGMKWFRKSAGQDNLSAKRVLGLLCLIQEDAQCSGPAIQGIIQWVNEYPWNPLKL